MYFYYGSRDRQPLQEVQCVEKGCTTLCSYPAWKCEEHLHADVYVGPTTLRRCTFDGLFASRRFEPRSYVVPYTAETIDTAELNRRYPGPDECAPYVLSVAHDTYLDAALHRGPGAFVNHDGDRFNAMFVYSDSSGAAHLAATSVIHPGEEILADYGPTYFDQSSVHVPHITM